MQAVKAHPGKRLVPFGDTVEYLAVVIAEAAANGANVINESFPAMQFAAERAAKCKSFGEQLWNGAAIPFVPDALIKRLH